RGSDQDNEERDLKFPPRRYEARLGEPAVARFVSMACTSVVIMTCAAIPCADNLCARTTSTKSDATTRGGYLGHPPDLRGITPPCGSHGAGPCWLPAHVIRPAVTPICACGADIPHYAITGDQSSRPANYRPI